MTPGVKLFQQPRHLLPKIWSDFLTNEYGRSCPSKLAETTDTSTEVIQHSPHKKTISRINGQFVSSDLQNKDKLEPTNKIAYDQTFLKKEENLPSCEKLYPSDSKVQTSVRTCKNRSSKNKSCLHQERNVVKCRVSNVSKVCAMNTSESRPESDIKVDEIENLKKTKESSECKISKNKIMPCELSNCKEDASFNESDSSLNVTDCGILSSLNKKTKNMNDNNCSNSELKHVPNIHVNSKPIENHHSVNSRKLKPMSHKPRPPSTVKLKETQNLTSKYNHRRFKVPTSFISAQKTPKS